METYALDRLVGGSLALYLLPALLVVLAVGGIGMLALAAGRLVSDVAASLACRPRESVGQEVFRS